MPPVCRCKTISPTEARQEEAKEASKKSCRAQKGVAKKPIQTPYRLISAAKDKARGPEKRAIGPMGQKIGFLRGW